MKLLCKSVRAFTFTSSANFRFAQVHRKSFYADYVLYTCNTKTNAIKSLTPFNREKKMQKHAWHKQKKAKRNARNRGEL